jgi:AcrR family transcriptional regulator
MARVRADAHRNRERLLAAATVAFTAADGTAVSLEAIARDAGVGIGTLYRHFSTREALIEAVYCTELAEVAASAGELLERHPPLVALRRWMDRYAAFVAAKRGMAESLRAMFAAGTVKPSDTRTAWSAPSRLCCAQAVRMAACGPTSAPRTSSRASSGSSWPATPPRRRTGCSTSFSTVWWRRGEAWDGMSARQ